MSELADYDQQRLRVGKQAALKGHTDPASLRELLICTTSTTTAPAAEHYFDQHRDDAALLQALVEIALEGEDAGDAPWAAANEIEKFPVALLKLHQASLESLGREQWMYLHAPARRALAKIAATSPVT